MIENDTAKYAVSNDFINMEKTMVKVNLSIYDKKNRYFDTFLKILIYLSGFFSVAVMAGIVLYIAYRGIPAISVEFITGVQSYLNNTFGILPNIINTLYIIIITLAIAAPIGIGSAIYLNEYAKGGKIVRAIEFTTETLSGIPSIIYGLFGWVFFGEVLKMGFSILCGSLVLVIMILPIITRTTQEALRTVPQSYRTGAIGMGATKWYMIRTIILPSSIQGIITGIILSIGRIVGESAALLFTAGSGFILPNISNSISGITGHALKSGGTMTIQMYLCMQNADYTNAFGIALVLLIIVLFINFITKVISKRLSVNKM